MAFVYILLYFCFFFYSFLLSYIFPFYGDHFFTNMHTIGIFKALGFRFFVLITLFIFAYFVHLLTS